MTKQIKKNKYIETRSTTTQAYMKNKKSTQSVSQSAANINPGILSRDMYLAGARGQGQAVEGFLIHGSYFGAGPAAEVFPFSVTY